MNRFRSRSIGGGGRSAFLAALLTTCVSAYASPAAGQVPGGETPVYHVYVTSERDLVEEITTARKISEETIEEKNARTLDEALVREPSLVLRRGGEGVARIDMRGLRTRQILPLLDGVPFHSTEDGNFDPSLIPSQIIESIDVTYSNSSVLYGDGPLAGVLQVRTRSGEAGLRTQGRGDFRGGMQYLGQASVAGTARGFEGFVAGSYLSSQGYWLPDDFRATSLEDAGLRENADRKQGNAFAKLGYVPSEKGRVDLLFDYRRAGFGVPWSVTEDDSTDRYRRNPNFQRVHDLEGFSAQLSGQLQPHEDLGLRSWVYVTRQREDRARYDDEDFDSIVRRRSYRLEGTTLIAGGALHGRYDLGAFGALRFAANGRVEGFDSEGLLCDERRGCEDRPFTEIDESHDLGAWSLGLEYEVQPLEAGGIVLGYGHAFLDADGGVSDAGSLFLGGAYYDFPSGTRLRGSAAYKLRFPSIRQLYAVDGGNPDLDAERCWCFELGIEQRLPCDTTLAVTGYWLELRDFIERPTQNVDFMNHQKWRNRGVEVTATSRPWEPLFLRLAYTFLDARDVDPDSDYNRLPNRPRHKIDGVAIVTLPWQMDFRIGFTCALGTLIYFRQRDPATGAFNSRHLDDFVLLDLKLEQPLWDDRLRLYVGVDNLLDEEWTYNYGFPQAGRAVFGGLRLRL
jgi:outer membrane cobalamin receptor